MLYFANTFSEVSRTIILKKPPPKKRKEKRSTYMVYTEVGSMSRNQKNYTFDSCKDLAPKNKVPPIFTGVSTHKVGN